MNQPQQRGGFPYAMNAIVLQPTDLTNELHVNAITRQSVVAQCISSVNATHLVSFEADATATRLDSIEQQQYTPAGDPTTAGMQQIPPPPVTKLPILTTATRRSTRLATSTPTIAGPLVPPAFLQELQAMQIQLTTLMTQGHDLGAILQQHTTVLPQ